MKVKKTGSLDAVSQLRRHTRNVPIPSIAEQRRLEARAQSGDSDARDRLVDACLHYMVSVAMEFQGRGVALDDLIDAGSEAVAWAWQRFDYTRGVSFFRFAQQRITGAMKDALRSSARQGHVDRSMYEIHRFIVAIEAQLAQVLGRWPTAVEIAREDPSLDVDDVARCRHLDYNQLSLNAWVYPPEHESGDDQDITWLERTANPDPWPDKGVEDRSTFEFIVRVARRALSAREMMVLSLYYWLDGQEPITLEHIGHRLGVSESGAGQLKDRAIQKLQRLAWLLLEGNGRPRTGSRSLAATE